MNCELLNSEGKLRYVWDNNTYLSQKLTTKQFENIMINKHLNFDIVRNLNTNFRSSLLNEYFTLVLDQKNGINEDYFRVIIKCRDSRKQKVIGPLGDYRALIKDTTKYLLKKNAISG